MSAQASSSSNVPPPLPLSSSSTNPPPSAALSPTLPSINSAKSTLSSPSLSSPSISSPSTSPDQQRLIAEARAALLASMSNIGSSLDSSLQVRAKEIHANTKVLETQEKELLKNTKVLEGLGGKLEKVAMEGGRKVKELGNVQNWAEVLERDFLVLGEVMRLVERGDSGSESESSWSSEDEEGADEGDHTEPIEIVGKGRVDEDGDTIMGSGSGSGSGEESGRMDVDVGKKGKEKEVVDRVESVGVPMAQKEEAGGSSSTATIPSSSTSAHTIVSGTS